MPQGDKSAYTDKQRREAAHIADGYLKRGVSRKEAEERAWRTVNAHEGGGKENGSGRKSSRSEAAKKGWVTRRKRSAGK
ncbi:plasmid stabilization protein [Sphingomonas sp. KRR8]|uniref:plasmid stabilization protein n=1 Tax=Sphingomonas sp. KRR8 TaxID=2942996 RepID=UPI002021F079|nr:plasmid stabilization protein [Sphingomonas sp. KRR8]URD59718.1 plasmid stabilization protein [Sphingomonas sp. KRR8]